MGMAKIKHLQAVHDLKSYRNACRVVKQLKPYIHETYHEREKVIYLNKTGRELIGSEKEVKNNFLIAHTLLRNEAYLHFNCPLDWKTECPLETSQEGLSQFQIQVQGIKPIYKKKVVADAVFNRNGYLHIVEIDNARKMTDNKKKIELYREMMPKWKNPILYIFTHTVDRQRKFEAWLKGVKAEVKLFKEIG